MCVLRHMATEVETHAPEVEQASVLYSVYRSVINQYALYTLFPMAATTIGMAIASVQHGWDWTLWTIGVFHFWLLDEGMKSVDLSADDINLQINSDIQFAIGAGMILAGFGVGIVLALMTTIWYIGWILLLILLGLAYNLEWFGGRLHDRKYVTGWGNLAFCLGWGCTVSGYIYLAEEISLGIALFAIGPMMMIGTMAWVEEDMKDMLYDMKDIEHVRETPTDIERIKYRALTGQLYRLFGTVMIAIGLVVEFGHLSL